MKQPISEEVQAWFDKHPECIAKVDLPTGYETAVAVYDLHHADIPIFGHYAIVFTDEQMEVWVADSIKHLEQQLRR